MFGWQMMSLKSAEIAGVFVPSKVRQRMDDFLNSVRQGKDGGLFMEPWPCISMAVEPGRTGTQPCVRS